MSHYLSKRLLSGWAFRVIFVVSSPPKSLGSRFVFFMSRVRVLAKVSLSMASRALWI